MFAAFARAFRQLPEPALRRPLVRSVLLAAASFAALWAGLWYLLTRTPLFDLVWLQWAVEALGGLTATILTVILFPVVMAAILSLFLDGVSAAVEARYYPGLPPPRDQPLIAQLGGATRFLAISILLNLVVLPLYLVPLLNLVVFYVLNGYLLGREYYEMVALRRLEPEEASGLWRRRRFAAMAAGTVIAFLSSVPLLNLAAPVVAVAAMIHLLAGWRRDIRVATVPGNEETGIAD
ncbi:MAG: EI24 domain-containing protein [Rhodospirillales bacterium]|nr:EI24 domain-containing protein [Rhodospirillales bacterium]